MMGMIMAYEISRTLRYRPNQVETPLGVAEIDLLDAAPVLITILRAGLPFMEGFQEVFSQATSGYIGAYRVENDTSEPAVELHYSALPELNNKVVILTDPMLATGQSLEKGIQELLKKGTPSHLIIASVVAAPEGVTYLSEHLDISYDLWLGTLDEELNDRAYIVPGLGDAGDLSFGEKF